MNLNQITVPSINLSISITFYEDLGLKLIVKDLPSCARFECPKGNATFSLHITLKLPYKAIGNNIIKEIKYFRVQNATSIKGTFVQGQLQSMVKVNTNTCISATFSGSAKFNGSEIIISEGIINHVYDNPF